MGVVIVGAAVFCYGLADIQGNLVAVGIAAVGLSIALRGVAEVTADLIARNNRNLSSSEAGKDEGLS